MAPPHPHRLHPRADTFAAALREAGLSCLRPFLSVLKASLCPLICCVLAPVDIASIAFAASQPHFVCPIRALALVLLALFAPIAFANPSFGRLGHSTDDNRN